MAEDEAFEVHLSYSLNSETRKKYEELNLPGLSVRTYETTKEFVLGVPRLIMTGIRMRQYIRRSNISVLVSPMVSIWQSLVLPLVLLGSKTRYVAFIHDGELHDGDQSKLMLLCYWLEFRFAKDIVVMSAAVGAQIRDRVRADQGLVETVHGSFGRESPAAEAVSRRADDKVVVGMFGRLNPYKGLDLFAESMEILCAEGLAVSGAVYGSGGPELEPLIRKHPKISWNIGWIDEDEVNSIVASFDILALPYREASQSGIVALAVAEGVPMVATPVGGLKDQVLGSGAGIVAEAVDAIAFSNAVRRLVSNADLRAELSGAGLQAASSLFSWTRVVADIRPALLGKTQVHE